MRQPFVESETIRTSGNAVAAVVKVGDADFTLSEDYAFRTVDQVKGEVRHLAAVAPAITVTTDATRQFVPANTLLDRSIEVRVTSTDSSARTAEVILDIPPGPFARESRCSMRQITNRYPVTPRTAR